MNVDYDEPLHDDADFLRSFRLPDRAEMRETHENIANTILLIGGDRSAYRRERRQQARAIVSEIYSAPRVTSMAARRPKYGLTPGLALDLSVLDDDWAAMGLRPKGETGQSRTTLRRATTSAPDRFPYVHSLFPVAGAV